jgi:predicted transcriptional regulator
MIGSYPNGRRDEIAIMKDLLQNMYQPTRLTHMLYKTNLSHGQLRKYLKVLVQMGLIEEIGNPFRSYSITSRGREFMQIVAAHPSGSITAKVAHSEKP